MIRWILEIDSYNFPIFSSWISNERNVILQSVANVNTTPLDIVVTQNGDVIPDRDGPDYDRELFPQERDLDWQYDDYDYRDQYDWRYEGQGMGQSWSYSDETLPMIERYV